MSTHQWLTNPPIQTPWKILHSGQIERGENRTLRMTIQRMEHVGIVVDDLAAATAFLVELGLVLLGEGPVEGA